MTAMTLAKPFEQATIVFDLDGTVADTAPDLIIAANAVLQAEGFKAAPSAAIKAGVGYGTKRMLRAGLTALNEDVDEARLERMAKALIDHYEAHIADHTRLFPSFLDSARALQEKGASLMICTNKPERLALKLLDALDIRSLFSAVAGGDTFAFRKPDPRHILELLQSCNRSADFAIMVGDSEADVAAAKAAGVPVVAVGFGYAAGPVDQLGADHIVNDFKELTPLVTAILSRNSVERV